MAKAPLFIAAVIGVLAAVAQAEDRPPIDPYFPNVRIPSGWARGLPILPVKRSAVYLTGADRERFAPTASEVVLANFEHDTRLWIAKIDLEGVQRGTFVLEHWAPWPTAVHANFRVHMRPGHEIKLYPQDSVSSAATRPVLLEDLLLSSEGFRPGGKSVMNDLTGMLDGSFPLSYRIKSIQDALFEAQIQAENKRPLTPIPLCVDGATCSKYLRNYLDESDRARLNRHYSMLLRNCASELYRQMDAVSRATLRGRVGALLGFWGQWLPGWAKSSLACRGLIDKKASEQIPNLEEEKAELLGELRARYEGITYPHFASQKVAMAAEIPPRALVLWSSSDPESRERAEGVARRIAAESPGVEVILKDASEMRRKRGFSRVLPKTDFETRLAFFVYQGKFQTVAPVSAAEAEVAAKLKQEGRFGQEVRVLEESLPAGQASRYSCLRRFKAMISGRRAAASS